MRYQLIFTVIGVLLIGCGGRSDGRAKLSGITAVAGGDAHSIALMNDGTVWTWGWNVYGQLGDGTTTNSLAPVQVKGPGGSGQLNGIMAVAGGMHHTIALKNDGTVWTWGLNALGQLGDGTTTDSPTPVQVVGPGGSGFLTGVIAIAGGYGHTVALKSDGTVWSWGFNQYGQLGDNTTTSSSMPVQVVGPGGSGFLSAIKAIACGESHSIALMNDGIVWAWGAIGVDNWVTER